MPEEPSPEELAKEINGYATADFTDATGAVIKAGTQLAGFGQLKDDGSTASGCWIFCGSWTEAGNQMARRDNSDPYGMKQHQGWAWAWPANRRILYNRASCDPQGKPWDREKTPGVVERQSLGRHRRAGLQGRRRHRKPG